MACVIYHACVIFAIYDVHVSHIIRYVKSQPQRDRNYERKKLAEVNSNSG